MDVTVKYCERNEAVEVALNRENGGQTITYSSEDVRLSPRGEAAVAGVLPVAMAAGEDMHVEATLDQIFYHNLSTVQDIYSMWGEGLSQIDVQGQSYESSSTEDLEGRTAIFFSGGVDSFYTFLKHKEDVDALVFVHGFDLALGDSELRSAVSRRLYDIAEASSKQFIEVETTLRSVTEQERFTSQLANWEFSHGSALASVTHLLPGHFDTVYVSATRSYRQLAPWGSHPILDPLWSRSDLEIIHDGCEATRLQKVEAISESRLALENLRVCWKNPDQAYNCGRCEKCRRTMLELLTVGSLEHCSTFPETLESSDIEAIRVREKTVDRHYREVAERLSTEGRLSGFESVVRKMLLWSKTRRIVKKLLYRFRNIIGS